MMLVVDGGETRFYYHYDGLGSVVALSNNSGVIAEQYHYDIFGTPDTTSSVGNRFMFTGREYDTETSLYYYRARYYKPSIGRFLQTDPIGYSGGINLYAYCDNNPIGWADPYGLCKSGASDWLRSGWMNYALMVSYPFLGQSLNTINTITTSVDYYRIFRAAGLGPVAAGLQSANMLAGKVLGYGTLAEGMVGVDVGSVSETHGWKRAGQVAVGAVGTAVSVVAGAQGLHAARGALAAPLHGNNLNTTKPAQGYTLKNRDTGELLKYGETTLGKQRYSKAYLNKVNAKMRFETSGTKRAMHNWNHEQILDYKAANNGARPPMNLSDW